MGSRARAPCLSQRDGDKLIVPKGSAPGDAGAVGAQPKKPHMFILIDIHTHTYIYPYIYIYTFIYISVFPLCF